jgi:hypothetical protein
MKAGTMTVTTRNAPPGGGANQGDAEAYNHSLATGTTIPDQDGKTERLAEHNRRVVDWAEQFDLKYRKVVKTLGWMADADTGCATFKLETFRKRYREFFGDVGRARATVFRRLSELETAGVIQRIPQYREDGLQRSTKYVINFGVVIRDGVPVPSGRGEKGTDTIRTPGGDQQQRDNEWRVSVIPTPGGDQPAPGDDDLSDRWADDDDMFNEWAVPRHEDGPPLAPVTGDGPSSQ